MLVRPRPGRRQGRPIVGTTVKGASAVDGKVRLDLVGPNGEAKQLECDHVIAATGYRTDLDRITIIDPTLRAAIKTAADTPVLTPNFESTVPGLYFVGATAANSFGPMLRFAYGSRFVARRLTRHLVRASRR